MNIQINNEINNNEINLSMSNTDTYRSNKYLYYFHIFVLTLIIIYTPFLLIRVIYFGSVFNICLQTIYSLALVVIYSVTINYESNHNWKLLFDNINLLLKNSIIIANVIIPTIPYLLLINIYVYIVLTICYTIILYIFLNVEYSGIIWLDRGHIGFYLLEIGILYSFYDFVFFDQVTESGNDDILKSFFILAQIFIQLGIITYLLLKNRIISSDIKYYNLSYVFLTVAQFYYVTINYIIAGEY